MIVDTNTYVRLYVSPVRPLMGQTIGGWTLLTLDELSSESLSSDGLAERCPWVLDKSVQSELQSAKLKLRSPKKELVLETAKIWAKQGNALLRAHCNVSDILLRQLSPQDAKAGAAADVLEAILATDEWPLTMVCDSMGIETKTSLDVLKHLESNGVLSAEDRHQTVRAWVLNGEGLPKNWQATYRLLFSEEPPDGQSAPKAH